MKKAKVFFAGFMCASLVIAVLITSASFATTQTGTISAVLSNIKIILNGIELKAKDNAGNELLPIIYNGNTYLPLKAIADAVNIPAVWHGKSKTVFLGKNDLNLPAAFLTDLKPFFNEGLSRADDYKDADTDNVSNTYVLTRTIVNTYSSGSAERIYNLNGKYSKLTGTYYLMMYYRDYSEVNKVEIYADDNLIYSGSVSAKAFPQNFSLDLQNCNQLKIKMMGYRAAIANLALYP